MFIRRIYWKNVGKLSKKVKKTNKYEINTTQIEYSKVAKYLQKCGVKNGSLLLLHSSYAPFKGRGKSPNEIIDFLFELIGPEGTLAMPAMPKYKNSIGTNDYLKAPDIDAVYHYDVKKSRIKTGVLPLMLHKRKSSLRSRHPINTMVAEGPLAAQLFQNNLLGNSPLACGEHSSWNKCVNNEAYIVGFGTDLTHSLTLIHVAEDLMDDNWPIDNWYVKKTFRITDDDFDVTKVLRERAPKWGALHFAERTLCRDLINSGILKSMIVEGVLVEVIKSKDLIDFLNNNNKSGYPYFWVDTKQK